MGTVVVRRHTEEVTTTEDPSDDGSQVGTEPSPWWAGFVPRTPLQVTVGVLALSFLAGAVGFVLGTRDATPARLGADSVAVGFLYDMTAHHEQALVISSYHLQNGEDPSALVWSREIMRSQAYEIGLMEMRLGTFGFDPADRPANAMVWMGHVASHDSMPGMASRSELEALRSARGAEADALFYALMIDHHLGGVHMAVEAARRAEHPWVAETAATMAAIQLSEISEMVMTRDRAGLPPLPAGFTPDHSAADLAAALEALGHAGEHGHEHRHDG